MTAPVGSTLIVLPYFRPALWIGAVLDARHGGGR
jgi:hypothetical protein